MSDQGQVEAEGTDSPQITETQQTLLDLNEGKVEVQDLEKEQVAQLVREREKQRRQRPKIVPDPVQEPSDSAEVAEPDTQSDATETPAASGSTPAVETTEPEKGATEDPAATPTGDGFEGADPFALLQEKNQLLQQRLEHAQRRQNERDGRVGSELQQLREAVASARQQAHVPPSDPLDVPVVPIAPAANDEIAQLRARLEQTEQSQQQRATRDALQDVSRDFLAKADGVTDHLSANPEDQTRWNEIVAGYKESVEIANKEGDSKGVALLIKSALNDAYLDLLQRQRGQIRQSQKATKAELDKLKTQSQPAGSSRTKQAPSEGLDISNMSASEARSAILKEKQKRGMGRSRGR